MKEPALSFIVSAGMPASGPVSSNVWSCSRYNANNAWNSNGNNGFANNNNFNNSNLAVPCTNQSKSEKMVTLEDIYAAYLTTRRNKRRSADSVAFEIHWQRNIVKLADDINNRTLSPTAYTFITTKPRPREVFACDMATRIVHHYIDIRLRPLIERRLAPRTFNNRVGYGQNAAINQLIEDIYEVSAGFTRDAWIIKTDIHGYFPNAVQDIVCKQLTDLAEEGYSGGDKDELLYMIQASVHSYPQLHCYRKSPMWKWCLIEDSKSLFKKPLGIGGAIGHLIWQNAMNYYINDIDHWLIDELGLHVCRFVDDIVIVTDNKECALAIIPELRHRLAAFGCELHPKKFYCQHYTKGVEFIGMHIKMDRAYVNRRIVRHARERIRQFNKCPRAGKVADLLASMNSYLGILKSGNNHKVTMGLLALLDERWLRFVHYNPERGCLEANEGYRTNQVLARKYNLKLKPKHNEHTRTDLC